MPLQKGEFLFDQLVLKGLRSGGHKNALALIDRTEDERNEVAQGLSHSGPRLHQQRFPIFQGCTHFERHVELLGAVFIAGKRPGEDPPFVEEPVNSVRQVRGQKKR
jgi:hypothetical protein